MTFLFFAISFTCENKLLNKNSLFSFFFLFFFYMFLFPFHKGYELKRKRTETMFRYSSRLCFVTSSCVLRCAGNATNKSSTKAAASSSEAATAANNSNTSNSETAAPVLKEADGAVQEEPKFNPYDSASINYYTEKRLIAEQEEDRLLQEQEAAHAPKPQPKFFMKGRRGSVSPEYYVSRSAAGHADPVAELLDGGRPDNEWMWIKFLCLICVGSTFGTWLYQVYFSNHVKYFKDEPWSPSSFRY